MTARLPVIGGDKGNWGNVLNDFLTQSLNSDGTLKNGIVNSATMQNGVLTALPSAQQAGTNYTLAATDAGTVLEFTASSAVTVTIPPSSSINMGTDTIVNIFQAGTGQITVSAGAGVILLAPDGAKSAKQYAELSLRRRGSTDTWVVSGNVTT